jgi:hypothetical protein
MAGSPPFTESEKAALSAYAEGALSWREAADILGTYDYDTLVSRMQEAGLSLPEPKSTFPQGKPRWAKKTS